MKLTLPGKIFGRIIVLPIKRKKTASNLQWLCKCDCGKEKFIYGHNLTTGHTKSCGCYRKESSRDRNGLNLKGKKFNRLMVVGRITNHKNLPNYGKSMWMCQCDCGNITKVRGDHLIDGTIKSCGCYCKYRMRSGQTHPAWQGGLTALNIELRNYITKTLYWQRDVIIRDSYTCQKCNSKDDGLILNAHHIIQLNDIVIHYGIKNRHDAEKCDLISDINNGISLCEDCHKWVHGDKNRDKEFLKEIN